MQKAYKLLGKHRHYDWGGNTFLPNLMGVENVNHLPYAEYWMGTHPLAASTIQTTEGEEDLAKLINEQPVQWLGCFTRYWRVVQTSLALCSCADAGLKKVSACRTLGQTKVVVLYYIPIFH